MEPFIGEIRLFAGSYAPNRWALCHGQTMSIQTNQALFSLLGTRYGGNGMTTFHLPDLRGRVPVHRGQGPGLSPRAMGQVGGVEQVTLLASQVPTHTHAVPAADQEATSRTAVGNAVAMLPGSGVGYAAGPPTTALAITSVTGNGQQHPNLQPYLALNYIISLFGVYPSRQ